jgi:hypothetical protein
MKFSLPISAHQLQSLAANTLQRTGSDIGQQIQREGHPRSNQAQEGALPDPNALRGPLQEWQEQMVLHQVALLSPPNNNINIKIP